LEETKEEVKAAEKKEKKRKGKKPRKNRPPSQKWKKYVVEGGKVRRVGKFCPKCGPGVFLAEHEDRLTCGSCGYTIFKKGKEK